MIVYYDPVYTDGLHPEARFPRDRYRLLAERLLPHPDLELRLPEPAAREDLILAHDPDYVDRFLSGQLTEKEMRRIGLRPWTDQIVTRTLQLTGGSLMAMEQALASGGIAGNMAGGTHHAFHAEGSGYCVFNDLAIVALKALQRPEIEQVLILDLDVHQGDGTAAILRHNAMVHTISIHGAKNFPFRKQHSDWDIPLPDGTGDREYLKILEQVLTDLERRPVQLLLFQAGVDPLKEDHLGHLHLSRQGLDRRNRMVFEWAQQLLLPVVVFMGGGYAQPIEASVDAFVDLFTVAASHHAARTA
jgi:acetoin utilization deacetylase AcuC-like enzyme